MSFPIAVIGATGKTGRRIVQQLIARGEEVRGLSRGSNPGFDWQQPAGWSRALRGVKSAYISFFPDLAIASAPAAIERLTQVAKDAGLERLVLLSGRGEKNAQRCESIVQDSGLDFTLIRASWFSQNFNEGQLLQAVREGVVALPAGQVREPFVDVDDITDVAVAALTERRHAGKLYELTGPRLLSFAEAAKEISQAAGRSVQYAAVSSEVFHDALSQSAGPEVAQLLTELCKEVFDGRNESLANGVQQALGRPPRDFAQFCQNAAASGVWAA